MSIRSFVASCSLLLMVWLSLAFIYNPEPRGGATEDQATILEVEVAQSQVELEDNELEENLAVSVSP